MELKLGLNTGDKSVPSSEVTYAMIEAAKAKFGEVFMLTARPRTEKDSLPEAEKFDFKFDEIEEETKEDQEAIEIPDEKKLKEKYPIPEGHFACFVVVPSRAKLEFVQNFIAKNKIKSPTRFYEILLRVIWLAGDNEMFQDQPLRAVIPQLDELTERMVGELKKL